MILLLFPHVLLFGAICAAIVWVYSSYISVNPYFRLAVISEDAAVPFEPAVSEPVVIEKDVEPVEKLPVIYFESQWATLNVDGWSRRDIPVYFGDSDEILSRGAGMWFGSRFCGQGGKTVLSGHVMTDFFEIEDTEVGDIVRMDTVYGKYEYVVKEKVVFNYQDTSLILDPVDTETLVMYTCYPRENGLAFKTERLALVCEKVSGKDYAR